MSRPPLIVITGPTASGKTSLAIELAERWGGEIICADSRTVYKGMDIGTAKPNSKDQARIRHWLLGVVQPGERFTVADFQRLAFDAIKDIRSRGKIPMIVGGSGLYIDSVVLSFELGPVADSVQRKQLDMYSIEQLQTMIKKQHLTMPTNDKNKRHLVRCIEKNNTSTSGKTEPEEDTYVVAIQTEKSELEGRIGLRASQMFDDNIVQETQRLFTEYGRSNEAMTGNIYPIVADMIDGKISREEAEELSIIRDRQLAKRQITWLKRHSWVRWLSLGDAEQYFNNILSKYRDA